MGRLSKRQKVGSRTLLWRTSEKEKPKVSKNQKNSFQLSFVNSQSVLEAEQAPTRASKGDLNPKKICLYYPNCNATCHAIEGHLRTGALSRYFQSKHVRREL
ncbi:hypothetical protein RO3G_13336 [Rhizopus delemar RA 99-880]|uniref:Uncharacterized protein n=1 Tax=Rhizopus delemar (strain RA 99-880 / ATCC MYA-4621 / FGSC 9543 / NRRL 43880) TaxID=246409 RepID=I1CJJ5_RHIO9|nr:hypothetical protein RO3G_13336 [Rhizopus delemar RA 99-880]|eukprot:EIE88625.1 hypothetical protein RO3G_13336 [Rhizopus delemar RA 99-880]